MGVRPLHIVLTTHWDREGDGSFQERRFALTQLLDRVLDAMLGGRLPIAFFADGQSILLEDYLEIRPERLGDIQKLAESGRLLLGPWYVRPAECATFGEALVRNLRLGRDLASAMGGKPSAVGYLHDAGGHCSQLPQILMSFGIPAVVIWGGVNKQSLQGRWRGPDGTVVPFHRCGPPGPGALRLHPDSPAAAAVLTQKAAFHAWFDRQVTACAAASEAPPVLLLAVDDTPTQAPPPALAWITERIGDTGEQYKVRLSTLDLYLRQLAEHKETLSIEVEGELREPSSQPESENPDPLAPPAPWLGPGVLSSRVWLKQANAQCQALLCQWAEPFGAYAFAALGGEYPQGFLDVAWRALLQNQAERSLGGTSCDQVHRDMAFRFDQCRAVGESLTTTALRAIALAVDHDLPAGALRVAVFNPLPRQVQETLALTLKIPASWPLVAVAPAGDPQPAFRLTAPDGFDIPCQRLGQTLAEVGGDDVHVVQVALELSLPPLGYTTFALRPGDAGHAGRPRRRTGLATGDSAMANQFLGVAIAHDGTLTLTDRRNGQVYARLFAFEDSADLGDGWYHGPAMNTETLLSHGARVELALLHDGPLLTAFRVQMAFPVPTACERGAGRRSRHRTEMLIDSVISLRHGLNYVDVETTVHNTAADHRLRVLFATGVTAQDYVSDSLFDVVERTIALQPDQDDTRELEVETRPQQSWTAIWGGGRGLAVVAPGLLESTVRDLPDRPLAFTLLRAAGRQPDGSPSEGQGQGVHHFRFRLVPLNAAPDRRFLTELAQQLQAGHRLVQVVPPPSAALSREVQSLAPTGSLLKVTGPVIMSSLRRVSDNLELRLWNPNSHAVVARLDFNEEPEPVLAPKQLQWVSLESTPTGGPRLVDPKNGVEIPLGAKEIVTLRIE